MNCFNVWWIICLCRGDLIFRLDKCFHTNSKVNFIQFLCVLAYIFYLWLAHLRKYSSSNLSTTTQQAMGISLCLAFVILLIATANPILAVLTTLNISIICGLRKFKRTPVHEFNSEIPCDYFSILYTMISPDMHGLYWEITLFVSGLSRSLYKVYGVYTDTSRKE